MKIIKGLTLLLLGIILIVGCSEKKVVTPDEPMDKGEFEDVRDGQVYKWVKIDNRVWMSENLAYENVAKHITNNDDWIGNSSFDGWCYYNDNDSTTIDANIVLYQWEAAKEACPSGWHLPTDKEWNEMENYLAVNGYSYDSIIGNNYIAKSLATDSSWATSSKIGVIGNSDYPQFINKTGFSAFPNGYRSYGTGLFDLKGERGYWWSATEGESYGANYRHLSYNISSLSVSIDGDKAYGFSVRCVRDY